jgi:hypothetical protein
VFDVSLSFSEVASAALQEKQTKGQEKSNNNKKTKATEKEKDFSTKKRRRIREKQIPLLAHEEAPRIVSTNHQSKP